MAPKGASNLVREASDVSQLLEYLFAAHSNNAANGPEFPWRGAKFAVSRLRSILRQLDEAVDGAAPVIANPVPSQARRITAPSSGIPKVNAPNIAHRIQRAPTTVGHVRQVGTEHDDAGARLDNELK